MEPARRLRIFGGAVAVITGGASGIGRALGEALARQGAHVVLADLQVDLAKEVAAQIAKNGGQAIGEELDVADFPATKLLIENTFQRENRLDYVFNNAGIGIVGETRFHQIEDWNRVLDVNLRGVIHGLQAAYPIMLRQGFGHIVNTASLAGLFPYPLLAGYCASKHAVVGLSLSVRNEAAAEGVGVSVLCPGPVRTRALIDGGKYGRMVQPIPAEVLNRIVERQHPIRAEQFAERALRAVARNRAVIVIPSRWKMLWWLYRLSPAFSLYLGRKGMEIARRNFERFQPKPELSAPQKRSP